jgi:hypothetical protein
MSSYTNKGKNVWSFTYALYIPLLDWMLHPYFVSDMFLVQISPGRPNVLSESFVVFLQASKGIVL